MDFETMISSGCEVDVQDVQPDVHQPTDGPHKPWILKWISKIKVQTTEQYRRRRRRRLYRLLQYPACMLSSGMPYNDA